MAEQQVVEYCFSAEPSWTCDAIECTKTGIEFNFEKLCQLCRANELPQRITIHLESPLLTAGEGGSSAGQTGAKSIKENEGGGRRPSATAPAAAIVEESLLAKEIRMANDREEMLRLERLQRSAVARPQPDAAGQGDGKNASAAADVTTASDATATAKPLAAGVRPTAANASLASSLGVSVTASAKLFTSSEFTWSPQYKNEDPVKQDVRIALQREEEIRQQRAIGSTAAASSNKQQLQPATSALEAADPASSTRPPTSAPSSGRSASDVINGTTQGKSTAQPTLPISSSHVRRDIVNVESSLATAAGIGETPSAGVQPMNIIEAEIREQMARDAEHRKLTTS